MKKRWWRAGYNTLSNGRSRKWAEKREDCASSVHNDPRFAKFAINSTLALMCTSFPMKLYPTEDSLPSHRREIKLYPQR